MGRGCGINTPHYSLPDVGKKYTRIGAVAEADAICFANGYYRVGLE
jgi:hypothetical protein